MSDTTKKLIPIYLVLVIYFFINILFRFTSLVNIYISYLNPLFLFLITILVYSITDGFKIRNRNRYTKKKNIIIILIIYFILYFLSGMICGFIDNGYSFEISSLFSNFISVFLIVIFREYIRYRLISSSKKSSNLFFITILFILLELDFKSLFSFSNVAFFRYFFSDIISVIIMNITSTYLIYRVGYLPNYLYRGISIGINLFSPLLPRHDWLVKNLFLLILLIVIVFYIDHLVSLEDRRKVKRKKDNFIVAWGPPFLVLIFVLFMLGFFKYQPIAILSDSMKGYYSKGDAVIIEKIDKDDIPFIQKDDIIYYRYDGKYITHRVYDIKVSNGTYIFYTKGDNNELVDEWKVNEEDIVGVVKFKVKYVGWPSVWLYDLLS